MLMASDITKCYTGRVGLGLDFDILYNAVQLINKTCPHSDLFFDHASDNVPRLTTTACEVIGQKGWCRYPNNEVWVRLSVHVWKLPLLQLVSQFSRPPLGLKGEVFAIVHLIGNPANTVFSLLKKLVRCQEISQRFRRRLRNGGIELALIVISYDELEVEEDNRAQDTILREYIDMRMWMNPDRSQRGWEWVRCERVASALAADRTTKFFPIVIALTLFVSALALALTRFSTSPPINSDPINVEAHSIAFSALYFYVITAVFLSSMIGVSQTEWAIPRILSDLEELAIVLPSRDNLTECRLLHGGLYSWQQWERYRNDSVLLALTFVSVAIGPLSSILISWYTPPEGWGCRHYAYIGVMLLYALSAGLDIPIGRRFWWAFSKDLVFGLMNLILVGLTQLGIFNSCMCWTRFGKAGLPLPEEDAVFEIIKLQFKTRFLYITLGGIGVQIIICGVSCWWFHDAYTVLVQRDDGRPNLPWLWTLLRELRWRRTYEEVPAELAVI